ncbi:MAG: hypothetical protein AB1486_07510 [Planctomycetota bacterium]
MRNTTLILVILLLAGATLLEKRARGHLLPYLRLHQDRHATARGLACAPTPVDNAETRRLEAAIENVDRRLQATESALRSLTGNEQSIDNLVRQAERDYRQTMREFSDAKLREIYEKNIADLRRQLVEVRTERARLTTYRDSLKAERIHLRSSLDLARITVQYGTLGTVIDEMQKPSPIESMEGEESSSECSAPWRRDSEARSGGVSRIVRTVILR